MTGAPSRRCVRTGTKGLTRTMADDAGRLNQVFAETSFLYGSNAAYIEELHEKWANDPGSVSAEWKAFFDQLRDNADSVKASASAGAAPRSRCSAIGPPTAIPAASCPDPAAAMRKARWPSLRRDASRNSPVSRLKLCSVPSI